LNSPSFSSLTIRRRKLSMEEEQVDEVVVAVERDALLPLDKMRAPICQ